MAFYQVCTKRAFGGLSSNRQKVPSVPGFYYFRQPNKFSMFCRPILTKPIFWNSISWAMSFAFMSLIAPLFMPIKLFQITFWATGAIRLELYMLFDLNSEK